MKGEIPSEIGLLTTLQYFDWGINLLDGGLPTSLCLLSKLTSLNVGENSLRGSLPYCLGQLTLLEQLDVHDNRLSGSLPGPSRSPLSLSSTHHHTNTTMQAMKRLFLSTNTFTGDPSPFWNDMTRLEIIMAGTNRFTAEINDEFLQNHVRLTWLDLSNNDFMLHGGTSRFSSIPAHLFEMSHLQVLDLSKNRLIGTIPSELKENNIMRYLSVYDNHLHSTVEQLKQLRSLHHLDVSRNALEGTLPPSFSQLSDLRLLFVGDNSFTANIVPTEWSTFLHLHELSLRQSRRNGTFDSENLPLSLVYLDLGSNELSGDLPTNMGNDFPHLEFLMLNDNSNITGELPETFKLMNKLSAVFLDGTGINGNVELVCELPNFVNENGHEIAFADCSEKYDDDQEFPFECDCCQCCEHNDLKNGCSIPYQANLKQAWARDFQTLSYTITNETVLLNREYIPPYIKT